MILEFSLFGFPIWSFSIFRTELQTEYDEGDEVLHGTGGNFEIAPRTHVPFGFSTGEEYEEEHEDDD